MTPEQLEAHRVRFEQRYAKENQWMLERVQAKREDNSYCYLGVDTAWQAYQWAIADADRAQRAAPGAQGGELPPITDEDREFLHDNPNTQDVVDWVRAYALSAVAAYQASQSMACAGPRCMHMPGRKGSMHSRECIEQAGLDQGWTPTAEELANAGPSYVTQPPQQSAQPVAEVTGGMKASPFVRGLKFLTRDYDSLPAGTKLYAAAQPVEVQRVPLTGEQLRDITRQYKAKTCHRLRHCWDDVVAFVRDVEAVHGIKPTSSEGGA